jgi:NAD(P)-dependent dehydrogenase (short-subunit alcohol dehydrogenase family)
MADRAGTRRPGSVLITGCSSGFGLETVKALAGGPWPVIATLRDRARGAELDAFIAGLPAASRDRVHVLELDVSDDESVRGAVRQALALGPVSGLVSNAGLGAAAFFEDMTDAGYRTVVETNFFGSLRMARALLPALRAQGYGRLVIMSSVGAFGGSPGLSAYTSCKWALEGWAESLAMEVAPFGLEVLLVEPGTYKTSIWDKGQVSHVPGSPYEPYSRAMDKAVRASVERHARHPSEVGRKIAGLLAAEHPPFRTPIGPDAHAGRVLARALPFWLRRKALSRLLGMTAAKRG